LQFWAAYTSCAGEGKDAVRRGLEQIDVMKRFISKYPDTFQAAYTADGTATMSDMCTLAMSLSLFICL